jgi:hypothetical protein
MTHKLKQTAATIFSYHQVDCDPREIVMITGA